MIFNCIDPTMLTANMQQTVECAANCTELIQLGESRVFWFVGKDCYHYRAFCSFACSLMVMQTEFMNHA